MQIISYLITGSLIGLADYFIFEDNKKVSHILKKLLIYVISLNVISLSILFFVFKMDYVLGASVYKIGSFLIKYITFTLVLGVVYLLIKRITHLKITVIRLRSQHNWKSWVIEIVLILFFAIGMIFMFFSSWFIDFFGKMTPEQFMFNLSSPIKGTSSDMVKEIITSPVFFSIVSIIIFAIFLGFSYEIYINTKNEKSRVVKKKYIKISAYILSLISLVGGVTFAIEKLSLDEVYAAYVSDSTYIEENYISPRDVNMSIPVKKKNLIHIYLESVESSFFSKELGGYMDENLMPELTELAKEGVHFSNTDKFGGAYQTYGSSWSVAGMVNMDMGIPLKVSNSANSYGKTGSFLPGAVNIGDILDAQGYEQTIMFGADADYGGLTDYFSTHGNFNIFDYKAAKENGLIPEDYNVWWGFEDKKLYEFAKDEITRLSETGKPFNFTMETADTHFPDGYLEKDAPKKHDSQYANVISYSTKEAVKFIKWIQQQSFYKDTTIVITGDHLSMDKTFFENFDKSYDRRAFNLILNSSVTTNRVHNREFASFDMYPTILASMGIEVKGDKLGLGTNLFSDEKTLIERDGLEIVEEGLGRLSNFYIEELLSEEKNSKFDNKLVTQRRG